jgi:hypothetical protein
LDGFGVEDLEAHRISEAFTQKVFEACVKKCTIEQRGITNQGIAIGEATGAYEVRRRLHPSRGDHTKFDQTNPTIRSPDANGVEV